MSEVESSFSITNPTLGDLRDFVDTASDYLIPDNAEVELGSWGSEFTLFISSSSERHSDEKPESLWSKMAWYDAAEEAKKAVWTPLGDMVPPKAKEAEKKPGECPFGFGYQDILRNAECALKRFSEDAPPAAKVLLEEAEGALKRLREANDKGEFFRSHKESAVIWCRAVLECLGDDEQ